MNTVLKTSGGAAVTEETELPARILVVDDDPDINLLMTIVLTRAGYHVDSVKDGIAGWEAVRTTGYDLMITDYEMPSVTGLDLIKQLRSEDMLLPVILTSGRMPIEEINQHPWLRIDALLEKPFTPEFLASTVRNVLHLTSSARNEIYFPMAVESIYDLDAAPTPKSSASGS